MILITIILHSWCIKDINYILLCEKRKLDIKNNIHNNYHADSCTTGNVKLVGGNTTSEGRVEYCYNDRWSALCTTGTLPQITASRIIMFSTGI